MEATYSLAIHNRLQRVVSVALPAEGQSKANDSTSSPHSATIAPGEVRHLAYPQRAIKKRRLDISVRQDEDSLRSRSTDSNDEKTLDDFGEGSSATSTASLRVLLSSRRRRHDRAGGYSWDRVELDGTDDSSASFWAMLGTPRMGKEDSSPPPLQLLLLPSRDTDNFMSLLPDSVCLSALSIPGTHETFARYGWPIAQCQEVTSTIRTQLEDGIRFMDFRVTLKGRKGKERLLAYHGLTAERIELGAALQQVYDFLEGERGKGETVVVSIKQEKGDRQLMKRLLFDLYVRPNEDKWFLSPKVPTLGEARGKIVMFSRFGESNEDRVGGIHPPIWPNNQKGIWEYTLPLSRQKVKTQDWFNIGSTSNIPVKFELASQLLDEAGADPDVFALDFISGATFPRATPPVVAKGWWETGPKCIGIEGMNRRMVDLIAGKLMQQAYGSKEKEAAQGPRRTAATPGLQACYAIDFYAYENAASLISLLIEANFTEEMVAARRAEHKAVELA